MRKLSIIIPVFNEKNTITEVLRKVFAVPVLDYAKEIIIIDDGSTDGTSIILENLQERFPFRLISQPENQGKGTALRTGFHQASGEIILIQDADLEYDPADWEKILKVFKNPTVSVVYGSRNLRPKRRGYRLFVFGVAFLTKLINLLFKSDLTDSYTCYKAFRRETLKKIELNSVGFEIEAEITAKILKAGEKISEVPINYSPRRFAEGKKIHWPDGLKGIWTILKIWIIK